MMRMSLTTQPMLSVWLIKSPQNTERRWQFNPTKPQTLHSTKFYLAIQIVMLIRAE